MADPSVQDQSLVEVNSTPAFACPADGGTVAEALSLLAGASGWRCTPLAQVTDTGFSMPAKAACRQVHERQRQLLKQKAASEGPKDVQEEPRVSIVRISGFRMISK